MILILSVLQRRWLHFWCSIAHVSVYSSIAAFNKASRFVFVGVIMIGAWRSVMYV